MAPINFVILGSEHPHSTISGTGYSIGLYRSGLVLQVDGMPYYVTTNHTGHDWADTLAKVGRLLTGLSPETRRRQLAECGEPRADGRYVLRDTVWTADGWFAGLIGAECEPAARAA